MRKKIYVGLGIVFLIFAGLYTYMRQKLDEQEHLTTGLRPNEVRKLVKKGNDITLTYRDKSGQEQKKQIKGNRNLSITEDSEGRISVYAPTKGWTFEPGLVVSASDKLRYGVDVAFLYWNNWALGVNATTNGEFSTRLGLVGMYNFYSNTFVFVGIDHKKEGMIGIRVRL